MIRPFTLADLEQARKIHGDNQLPDCCFPDLMVEVEGVAEQENPLYVERAVYEHEGQAAMMCFLKVRSELYLLLDHTVGTPQERMEWLKELKDHMVRQAWRAGLDQMSCFVPPDVDESFRKRLEELGFERSSFQAYSLNIP